MSGKSVWRVSAIAALLLSIAGAIWSGVLQQQRALLLNKVRLAQVAPIPPSLVPKGIALRPAAAPLTSADHRAIAAALWRAPLDEPVFNLLYADAVRTGAPASTVRRDAALLSLLGWRFTPAQQNLLIRETLDRRFGEIVDRADGLLRRQQVVPLAYGMLNALEQLPGTQPFVVAKLLSDPPWRRGYLSFIGPASPPELLSGRGRTLAQLLGAKLAVTRDDLAPSLTAMIAAGHAPEAYDLWTRLTGRAGAGNLLYDPHFTAATRLRSTPTPAIPFEWRFGQGTGFSAEPSSGAVEIQWDRHGFPTFLTQLVPVRPGQGYSLWVMGTSSESSALSSLLTPSMTCNGVIIHAVRAIGRGGRARFDFAAVPASCDMGLLTINGSLDTGSGNVSLEITGLKLIATS